MNPLDQTFWLALFQALALQAGCVVLTALLINQTIRSVFWRRALWQTTVICLLLLTASELSGFGRGLAAFAVRSRAVQARQIPPAPVILSPASVQPVSGMFLRTPPAPPAVVIWWPAFLWLAGFVIVLGRVAVAQLFFALLRRRWPEIGHGDLNRNVAEMLGQLGCRRKVHLLQASSLASPIAFGIIRPAIAFPPGFADQFSPATQEAVLAHELAHLAAHDPLWYLLADAASALFWWHPLVWWARRQLHRQCELAADQATAIVPDGPVRLAECLVNLGRKMTAPRRWDVMGVNMGGFGSNLGERVESLVKLADGAPKPLRGWRVAALKTGGTITLAGMVICVCGWVEGPSAFEESWHDSAASAFLMAAADKNQSDTAGESPTNSIAHPQNGLHMAEEEAVRRQEATIRLHVKLDEAVAAQRSNDLMEAIKLYQEAVAFCPLVQVGDSGVDLEKKQAVAGLHAVREKLARQAILEVEAGKRNVQVQGTAFGSGTGIDVAGMIQNAKLFYEKGKYDAAEALLFQVLKTEPANKTAPYYLNLLKEARFAAKARALAENRGLHPIPNATTDGTVPPVPIPNPRVQTNLVYTSAARQEILSKLNRIHFNDVHYDLPLGDVIKRLQIESKKQDPEGVGVNFMFDVQASTSGDTAMPSEYLNDTTVRFNSPLHDLRLIDVLDAVTKHASRDIRYTIQDYAVVFSPKHADEVLYTRVFKVDPNTFFQGLQNVTSINLHTGTKNGHAGLNSVTKTISPADADAMVKAYFTAAGVKLGQPGKVVFFNDRLDEIMVRASLSDLEIIEQAVELLNQKPPQLTIESKFVELSQQESGALGFGWYLGNAPTNIGTIGLQAAGAPSNPSPGLLSNPSGVFSGAGTLTAAPVTGIMTDPQFRVAINAVEHRSKADILAAPKVTTLSGRQTHISSSDADGGVTLDVLATVRPDGFAIEMVAFPSIKTGNQTWQASASCKLWDGQTLVVGSLTTNQPPDARKLRLVFITPTIIDPAGNRVHSDDELSTRTGIPDQ